MRVLTVDENELKRLCNILYNKVLSTGFYPDLILGIESGGANVAKILNSFFKDKPINLEFCKPVRNSTENKKSLFKNYLKKLPVCILDFLRIIEYKFFFNKQKRSDYSYVILPGNLGKFKNILVVDDAEDSGATLERVLIEIKSKNPVANVETAVLTVTTNNPVIKPDFFVFNNNTLIRFPWSIDAK